MNAPGAGGMGGKFCRRDQCDQAGAGNMIKGDRKSDIKGMEPGQNAPALFLFDVMRFQKMCMQNKENAPKPDAPLDKERGQAPQIEEPDSIISYSKIFPFSLGFMGITIIRSTSVMAAGNPHQKNSR